MLIEVISVAEQGKGCFNDSKEILGMRFEVFEVPHIQEFYLLYLGVPSFESDRDLPKVGDSVFQNLIPKYLPIISKKDVRKVT